MKKINDLLRKYALKPHQYKMVGKTTLIDTDDGRFVIKEKNRNDANKIYKYLHSRSFNYYPSVINTIDDDYEIAEYIEEYDIPNEQKVLDMIDLVSLLHNKTTHYKEVDESDYKKLYEDIANNIEYLYGYYNDIAAVIETKVYMSPSEYLLIRNISKIYSALNYCKFELENWYKLVEDKRKQRLVVLHNNLRLDHFLRNNNSYLISWDKSKIDLPVFDLYKLYKYHALDFDFSEILKQYERNYPLLEEERKLLFILIALPDKLKLNENEYKLCSILSKQIDMIYKTENLISPYYSEKTVKN